MYKHVMTVRHLSRPFQEKGTIRRCLQGSATTFVFMAAGRRGTFTRSSEFESATAKGGSVREVEAPVYRVKYDVEAVWWKTETKCVVPRHMIYHSTVVLGLTNRPRAGP